MIDEPDHSEKGVARDLEAWIPKVRPGGILCGHDYGNNAFPGVAKVVNHFFGKPDRVVDWFWAVDKR